LLKNLAIVTWVLMTPPLPAGNDFIEDPLETSPATGPKITSLSHGAALSTLRGPTGFAEDAAAREPSLQATEISVRLELYPDLVLVEQTYSLLVPGKGIRAVVGIHQSNLNYGVGGSLRSGRPLGSVAWLNKERLPDSDVRIESNEDSQGNPDGYRVAVTIHCPPGKNTLSLLTTLQSVSNMEVNGQEQPAATGWSYLGFQINHYAWGWAPDMEAADPKILVKLSAHQGTSLSRLHAEEWMPAMSDGSNIWWEGNPWVVLKYDAESGANRAVTLDELQGVSRTLLERRPRPHLIKPEEWHTFDQPNRAQARPSVDNDRTRRAMLVPTIVLALLLLAAFLVTRHRAKRNR
jgi:hypothetical protein